jgi:hypothetical protein
MAARKPGYEEDDGAARREARTDRYRQEKAYVRRNRRVTLSLLTQFQPH